MGRFINCFAVAILKLKRAAILDLIWSLYPQRVVIGKLLQSVSVCTMYAPYVHLAKCKQYLELSRMSTKYTSEFAKAQMGTWYRIQLMIYQHQRP